MIKSPLLEQREKQSFTMDDLPRLHHLFMKYYGWIPLKEFKEMPLSRLFTLSKFINEEERKSEELRLCTLKYYGVKHPK